jgi:hypothetical protein
MGRKLSGRLFTSGCGRSSKEVLLPASAFRLASNPRIHAENVNEFEWVITGASWYGFTTCWINRSELPFETMGPRPAFVGKDLSVVLNVLNPDVCGVVND